MHQAVMLLLLLAVPAPAPVAAPTGVWQSVGYGMVWQLGADGVETWEVTATTCVATAKLTKTAPPPGAIAAFLDAPATTWIIRAGWTSDRLIVHNPSTVSDIRFRRLRSLPVACRMLTANTIEANFEVFTRTMRENYAFFGLRGLDWDAGVAQARRSLTAATTPRRLYDLLEQLVAPLEDLHTDLTATDLNLRARHFRRSGGIIDPERYKALLAAPPRRYLTGDLTSWCQDWIQYGELRDSVAYLRVMREYSYTPSGRFEDDSLALTRALDSIMPRLARHRALVLDIRLNGGGADAISLMLASRLTATAYPAFAKQARSDPERPERFTPLQHVRVRPSNGVGFTGPVVLLTGARTLSAGEVLTLALMGRRPRIVRVGEATQGIFADELLRQLPNGWRFQLSSERYVAPDGTNYERTGIPPDDTVPVFSEADQSSGRDGALERALERLTRQAAGKPRQ
ncbi:MAG: S41 family peptidase [Gemmatimonadota bacterium]